MAHPDPSGMLHLLVCHAYMWTNDASGILGTAASLGGPDTLVFNAGSALNINDGDLTTVVDSYSPSPDTMSFVGILWTNTVTNALTRLDLSLATFFDGGWFGVNNLGPGAGGVLSSNLYLLEPTVQVSPDGFTWMETTVTSDFLSALEGHPLPAVAFGPPTLATAHFQFATPQTGLKGVRIIGPEGGTASGGFLGVFELAALVLDLADEFRVLNCLDVVLNGQRFVDCALGMDGVVQSLAEDRKVDAVFRDRRVLNIAQPVL